MQVYTEAISGPNTGKAQHCKVEDYVNSHFYLGLAAKSPAVKQTWDRVNYSCSKQSGVLT